MKKIKILTLILCCTMLTSTGCDSIISSDDSTGKEETQIETCDITIEEGEHGVVKANSEKIEKGDSVTFTFTADEGYVIDTLTINGNMFAVDGKSVTIADVQEELNVSYSFVRSDVVVSLETNTEQELADINVTAGKMYGLIPTPSVPEGKMFAGWYTKEGMLVSSSNYVTNKKPHTLYARWRELDMNCHQKVMPYSITVAYYDEYALSLGISFHTDEKPYDSVVQYCEGEAFVETSAVTVPAVFTEWENEYVSQAVLDSLEYGKTYTYRVGDATCGVWSNEYTLKTRNENAKEISFVYVTDTQQTVNNANTKIEECDWAKVMQDADSRFDFDFIVHGGDMVNYGSHTSYWKEMLGDVEQWLGSYPLVFTMGNHETTDYYAANVANLFQSMFNINYPEQSGANNGAYYSLDIGALHLIVIRAGDYFTRKDKKLSPEQIAWLREDAVKDDANEKTKWRVAVVHEAPIVPLSQTPTSNNHMAAMRQETMQLFRDIQLDLVLTGHNHFNATSYPLDYTDEITDFDGDGYTDYVEIVTDNASAVEKNGENVTIYENYISGEQGTVFHELAATGRQYKTISAFTTDSIAEAYKKWVYWQNLGVGGAGQAFSGDSKAYSFYDYITVTENTLTVKTYGVNYETIYDYTKENGERSKYFAGFTLSK